MGPPGNGMQRGICAAQPLHWWVRQKKNAVPHRPHRKHVDSPHELHAPSTGSAGAVATGGAGMSAGRRLTIADARRDERNFGAATRKPCA